MQVRFYCFLKELLYLTLKRQRVTESHIKMLLTLTTAIMAATILSLKHKVLYQREVQSQCQFIHWHLQCVPHTIIPHKWYYAKILCFGKTTEIKTSLCSNSLRFFVTAINL